MEKDLEGLDKIRRTYQEARKRLGGEHVLLTATVYASRTCSDNVAFYFDKDCLKAEWSGGVAGLVALPLWGLGGGHGSDWYPVLHTEEESRTFETFERRVRNLAATSPTLEALLQGKVVDVSDSSLEQLSRELLETVNALTRRAINDDASYYEAAIALSGCVQKVLLAGEDVQLTVPSGFEDALAAIAGSDLKTECEKALGAVKLTDRIKKARDLVREYFKLVGIGEARGSLSRHNFLIGPAVGFPVTENPTNIALWGVAAEAGARDSLRLGVAGGFVAAYEAPLAPMQGVFVGLSLSGEYGDDLVHFIGKAAR